MARTVLVTGGAGFVGSHVCVDLVAAGEEVLVLDDFSNSSPLAVQATEHVAGEPITTLQVDMTDAAAMADVFAGRQVDMVVHCAGLKAVGESVEQPLRYWQVNVGGTLTLLSAMRAAGVFNLVFSSSATVYGDARIVPIPESAELGATNPYGDTKLAIEQILRSLPSSGDPWQIVALRYFNPVGAHESGLIGEAPQGTPNNLLPRVLDVALGKTEAITVFGDDYDTPDGTGVRDYIHVVDLAGGHRAALDVIDARIGTGSEFMACNLGTGRGYSVLEVIEAMERASGREIATLRCPRRPGDISESRADATLAETALGWRARRGLDEMCEDSWRWAIAHPNGYE